MKVQITKVQIDMFLVKIDAGVVLYTKHIYDRTLERGSTDEIVRSYCQSLLGRSAPRIGDRCWVHSTGWHDEGDDTIVLTYLLYSEDFRFEEGVARKFFWSDVTALLPRLSDPKVAASEQGILVHALRHLAFFVQTDTSGMYENLLTTKNFRRLLNLPMGLAGKEDEIRSKKGAC
ncbi:MAG: hypothetical protein HYS15_03235 [Candidatus Spechtbacteria bacterium]|nr:hypothetical protein [Candidatus Spechtbacteria bacterium]